MAARDRECVVLDPAPGVRESRIRERLVGEVVLAALRVGERFWKRVHKVNDELALVHSRSVGSTPPAGAIDEAVASHVSRCSIEARVTVRAVES
jgi:hypothetical protein